MTISNTASQVTVQGNGAQTVFNYGFEIASGAGWSLYLEDSNGNITLLAPSAYTVSGIGQPAGGTFTYPLSGSPLAAGNTLTLVRATPVQQQTALGNQGAYYPGVVEAALDWMVMQTQERVNAEARMLRAPAAEGIALNPLPGAKLRAGGALGFDSTGQPTVVFGTPGDVADLADFGAAFDGVTDDTVAWQAAFAWMAAQTNGFTLRLPAGTSICNAALAATIASSHGFSIEGAGSGASVISFPNGTDGISLTLTAPSGVAATMGLRGFSVKRPTASPIVANTALTLTGTTSSVNTVATKLVAEDVGCIGNASGANGWLAGFSITDLMVSGNNLISTTQNAGAATCMDIKASVASQFVTDCFLSNPYFVGGEYGFVVSGAVQGCTLTNPTIIGQVNSIYWDATTTDGAEQLIVIGGALSGETYDVYAKNVAFVQIIGATLNRFSTVSPWCAIYLEEVTNPCLGMNNIFGIGSATETGIEINSTSGTFKVPGTVTGNVIGNVIGNAVNLAGFTSGVAVTGNAFNGVLNGVLDNNPGKNCIFANSLNGVVDVTSGGGVFAFSQALVPQVSSGSLIGDGTTPWEEVWLNKLVFLNAGVSSIVTTDGAGRVAFQSGIMPSGVYVDESTYTASPATGATYTIPANARTAIVDGTGTLAALTIGTLPVPANAAGSTQELRIEFNVGVTAITWPSGVLGAELPSLVNAGESVTLVWQQAKTAWVRSIEAVAGDAGGTISTITVGASPFTYTAAQAGTVSVDGGTVSSLQLTRGANSAYFFANTGVPMRAGDTLTVTYSSVPLMYWVPN